MEKELTNIIEKYPTYITNEELKDQPICKETCPCIFRYEKKCVSLNDTTFKHGFCPFAKASLSDTDVRTLEEQLYDYMLEGKTLEEIHSFKLFRRFSYIDLEVMFTIGKKHYERHHK